MVNSIHKVKFPSTTVYLHLENQTQISIQSKDIEDLRLLQSDWLRVCSGMFIPR